MLRKRHTNHPGKKPQHAMKSMALIYGSMKAAELSMKKLGVTFFSLTLEEKSAHALYI